MDMQRRAAMQARLMTRTVAGEQMRRAERARAPTRAVEIYAYVTAVTGPTQDVYWCQVTVFDSAVDADTNPEFGPWPVLGTGYVPDVGHRVLVRFINDSRSDPMIMGRAPTV